MKKILFLVLGVMLIAMQSFAVQVLIADFGKVQQGTSKQISFGTDAGLFTLTGDTPFTTNNISPFTVNPTSGTMRRTKDTTFTVTLPANTPPGNYDLVLNITVQKNSGPIVKPVPVKAIVVGFPYQVPQSVDLGNSASGSFQIKSIAGTKMTYETKGAGGFFEFRPFSQTINPGQTQVISILPGQLASGPASGTVTITDTITGTSQTVNVKSNFVNKPDLVTTIQAVKVFPRSAGATETNIQITLVIKNVGLVPSAACAGKIAIDNQNVLDLAIPALGGEFNQTVVVKSALSGTHKLKVKADIDAKNAEIDENNNDVAQDIVLP